jgi:outer membrane protein TolC
VGLALIPAAAAAQPISLEQVVSGALASSFDLQLAGLAEESARGAALAAAAPFDSALGISGRGSRGYQLSPPDMPLLPHLEFRQLTLATRFSRLFRTGILVAPEVTTSHTQVLSDPRLEYTRSAARLTLVVPLLRDFGGAVTAAPERAASAEHGASQLEQRHAGSQAVLRAAAAYWAYLAASRRLEVFAASEARASRTATDIAALVKADERTRADLAQARGTLASRRANRIAAEQDLLAAWEAIAVLTGTVRADLAALPPAATEFPGGDASPIDGSLAALVGQAIQQRPDVMAAQRRIEGAEERLSAARNELWPRLDLEGSAGVSGQRRGPGLSRLADPLYRDVPGADLAVQLTLLLPLERSGARGRLAQQSAEYQRTRLTRLELERRIRIGVATVFETVKRSRLALGESEQAVSLLQQTVEGEKHKFKLGLSTLFSVIQAEDSLTSALLAKIEGQRTFAMSLATRRFETGTQFAGEGPDGARAQTARHTSLPAPSTDQP